MINEDEYKGKDPDAIAKQKHREKREQTLKQIAELEEWIIDNPCTHPNWGKNIERYNALTIKIAQLNGEALHAGTINY